MSDGLKGNVKNPAIRRIHADIRELQKDPSDQYHASPLEENLFEWHFTIRGPPGTDFQGGIYHGRILLPSDYPFKPPNIMLLTPNGRFEVGKKICLSISAHHPEHWQPAWGVRLILEALISFFPTEPKGAVGSLDWTPEERRRLARESQQWTCTRCGLVATSLPELRPKEEEGEADGASATAAADGSTGGGGRPSSTAASNKYAKEIAQLYVRGASGEEGLGGGVEEGVASAEGGIPPHVSQEAALERIGEARREVEAEPASAATNRIGTPSSADAGGSRRRREEEGGAGSAVSSTTTRATYTSTTTPPTLPGGVMAGPPPPPPSSSLTTTTTRPSTRPANASTTTTAATQAEDDKLFYIATALFILIIALVIRKWLRTMNADLPTSASGGGGEGLLGGEEEATAAAYSF